MNLLYRILHFIKSFPHAFKRTKLRVVHEDDLLSLISSLGIAEDIQQGKFRCVCCETVISMDNLWGIISREGSIQLICSDPECLPEIY